MRFCVIIPCHNHGDSLAEVLGGISGADIFVVDDGSVPPVSISDTFGGVRLIRFDKNHGKAYALKAAFKRALCDGYTHAVTMDSDGQHPPSEVGRFLEAAAGNPDCIVAGVRNFSDSTVPVSRRFMNRFSNFWFKAETGVRLGDTQCGFRCYPISKISGLDMSFDGFTFESELLVKAAWAGIGIIPLEIPTIYNAGVLARSHYRPIADTVKFSIMNAKLWFQSLVFSREKLRKIALGK